MIQALYDAPGSATAQTPKDSWAAIALVFLGGTALLVGSAYYNQRRQRRPGAKRLFVFSPRSRT